MQNTTKKQQIYENGHKTTVPLNQKPKAMIDEMLQNTFQSPTF